MLQRNINPLSYVGFQFEGGARVVVHRVLMPRVSRTPSLAPPAAFCAFPAVFSATLNSERRLRSTSIQP
jgi:hypothetical protein